MRGKPLSIGAWIGIVIGIQLVLFVVIVRRPQDIGVHGPGNGNRNANGNDDDASTVACTVMDEIEADKGESTYGTDTLNDDYNTTEERGHDMAGDASQDELMQRPSLQDPISSSDNEQETPSQLPSL